MISSQPECEKIEAYIAILRQNIVVVSEADGRNRVIEGPELQLRQRIRDLEIFVASFQCK